MYTQLFIIAWKEGYRLQLISLVDLILHFGKSA